MRIRRMMLCVLAITMLLCSSCSSPDEATQSDILRSLSDIRSEYERFDEIAAGHSNLDLSETEIYIPQADSLSEFSLLSVPHTSGEREKLLLDAAERFTGTDTSVHDITYLPFDGNGALTFSETENDPDRGEKYYFIYYKANGADLGINIGGDYIYARRTKTGEIAGDSNYFVDKSMKPVEEYDLRGGVPDVTIELQDGAQALSDIVMLHLNTLSDYRYFNIDGLELCADKAEIYTLGEKYAAHFRWVYEYNGVPLDTADYNIDLDKGEYVGIRAGLDPDSASVWTNSVDEFYGAYMYDMEVTEENITEFIGLEDFISLISDKLTGNYLFEIESVSLQYGLERVFPEEAYSDPEGHLWEYTPIRLEARPVWIANIPKTGIMDTPSMRIVADAVTGGIELYG